MVEQDLSHSALLGPIEDTVSVAQLDDRYLVVDVRSESEFSDGSLPGAVNIPLFDEDERSVIGTIYRYGGKQKAVEKGVAYVSRKLDEMLSAFLPFRNRRLAVICARGGMRSRSIVNLLQRSGYDACQVEGGYKKYRNDVLERVNGFAPQLIVVHGLTGTGKTRIIKQLDNSIDLEEMAQHRSSLFGAIDKKPCNQKMFESKLAQCISRLGSGPYFIEGESRKIGQVFIPKPLAMAMKSAVMVRVDCSIQTRIRRIIDDYPVDDERTLMQVDEILMSLSWKLGKEKVQQMRDFLKKRDLEQLVYLLLVDYYDKRYTRSMRDYSYALELSSENIEEAAGILTRFRENYTAG